MWNVILNRSSGKLLILLRFRWNICGHGQVNTSWSFAKHKPAFPDHSTFRWLKFPKMYGHPDIGQVMLHTTSFYWPSGGDFQPPGTSAQLVSCGQAKHSKVLTILKMGWTNKRFTKMISFFVSIAQLNMFRNPTKQRQCTIIICVNCMKTKHRHPSKWTVV